MITAGDFNNNVLNIINLFSSEFYVVHPDERINCICINSTTKNPDSECPICLGTGHKIYIRKVEGAYQNTDIPNTVASKGSNDMTTARNYYIKAKYKMYQNDLIIDNDKVYFIFNSKDEKGFHGEIIFSKNTSFLKKFNQDIFLKNFKKIVGN